MNTPNLYIEKIVNKNSLKTAVICPGCEAKQTDILNWVFIRSRAVHLCKDCAHQYANVMRIINKVETTHGGYIVKELSGFASYFRQVDGDWFVQNPPSRFRRRLLTLEEEGFFLSQDEMMLHSKDDGDIEWWVLESDKPCVRPGDLEIEAHAYFIYAMHLNNTSVGPYETVDRVICEVELIYGKA